MKRVLIWSCISVALLASASCKRENLKKEEPVCPCQVKKIVQKTPGLQDRTGTFTYNAAGDPIGFTPAQYQSGSVKYEFRYDDNRRLTDYIGYYPTNTPGLALFFEFWTKYTYGNDGRVTRDTTYHYGMYGPHLTSFHAYKDATTYEYDKAGRIGRTVTRQLLNNAPNGVIADYKYSYNADGNLVKPGAAYDNKLSVYKTNRIWMFLNRNYSNNNLLQGTAYNNYGLPLGFSRGNSQNSLLGMLYFLGMNDSEIEYECK